MILELRMYTVTPGRIGDVQARFRDHLPPLLAAHGIRIIGCWIATAGTAGPMWVYMMAYRDLAERMAQWDSFSRDDRWWAARAETNAGEEMVERFDTHFLTTARPLPELPPGIDELLLIEVALGQAAAVAAHVRDDYLRRIEAAGGTVALVADFLTGPHLPRIAIMVRWPDAQAQASARANLDSLPECATAARAQRAAFGRALLGQTDSYLLRQPEWFSDGRFAAVSVPGPAA